jgi:uncharacterized peroxidase-related enzyme
MTQPKNGFRIHDKSSAPEASTAILEKVEKGFGFIPNVLGVTAESPAALEAYVTLNQILQTKTALSPEEQQVVLLAVSRHNGCGYCVAAHTASSERTGLDAGVIQALREDRNLPDPSLDAVATLCRTFIDKKGWLDESDIQAFLDAGHTRQKLLDVIVGLSMKTISNYINHIADTPLDTPLQPKALDKAS